MRQRHPITAGAGLVATISGLVIGLAILWHGGQSLPPLPLTAGALTQAVTESEPLPLAISSLRLVALGVGGGLLAIIALGIAARAGGAARLVVRLDRWTPSGLRSLLDGALGMGLRVGLVASLGLGTLSRAASADPGPSPAESTTTMIQRLADAAPTTLTRLPDAPIVAPVVAPESLTTEPLTTEPLVPEADVEVPSFSELPVREVTVQPGDSFWRLAERDETERRGRTPSVGEITERWNQLLSLNVDRLVVADNADLLFPGQILLLPPD